MLKNKFFLGWWMFLTLISGCSANSKIDQNPDFLLLNKQKEQWLKTDIHSYSYRYYSPGWAHQEVIVKVEKGKVVSIVEKEGTKERFYDSYYLIESLFDSIEKNYHLIGSNPESDIKGVSVVYHSQYGFPQKVGYRFRDEPGKTSDGNSGFQILDFQKN